MAVVVGGAGRAFCSGMDRTALAAGTIGEEFYRHWIRGLNRLEDMPKVTLAVLHGHSIGGGLQLGLACDLRLATEDAVLGLGASRHGIIPDGGVLRLARLVGLGRAKELALLNDDISPAEARAIGLVNWVCAPAEVEATVAGLVERLRHRRRPPTPTSSACSTNRSTRSTRDDRGGHDRPARLHDLVGDDRGQPGLAGEARGHASSAGPPRP